MISTDFLRVTDVLFPFSGLTQVPRFVLDKAADKGKSVHDMIESVLEAEELGLPSPSIFTDTIQGYMQSFNKWNPGTYSLKPERFYCEKYGITGECDALFENKTGFTLVDFKTSSKESKTWQLQGSAYAYLARLNGYNINRIEFIKLSKTGEEPEVFLYEEDFSLFLDCLKIYKIFYKDLKIEEVSEAIL